MHTHQNLHRCTICDERFPKFTQLRTHRRHVHSLGLTEKKHTCKICNAKFVHPNEVVKHVEIVHELKREHLCEVCGDKFHRVSALNLHKRKHTNERPYSCKVCRKTFARPDDCKKHARRVHSSECKGRLNNPFTSHLLPYEKIYNNEDSHLSLTVNNQNPRYFIDGAST